MLGLTLGVMVDLCDNPKVLYIVHVSPISCVKWFLFLSLSFQSLSHVTAWQGDATTNCWSLIAGLWSREEKRLGVIRDMGTLAGIVPLAICGIDCIVVFCRNYIAFSWS